MNPSCVLLRLALSIALGLSAIVAGCSAPPLVTQEDISPDGFLFASPDRAEVNLTRTSDDQLIRTLSGGHEARIAAVHFSPAGDRLVSGDLDGRIVLWSARDGKNLGVLEGHRGAIE